MQIETVSNNNLEALVHLVLELWPDDPFDEAFEDYQKCINADNEVCYLLSHQGNYIAFIHLTLRHDYVEGAESSPVAYVEAIYIRSAFRKMGAGTRLLKAGEDWAKQKGLTQLASDTASDNTESIAFHTRTGFSEVNRIVCFIKQLQ